MRSPISLVLLNTAFMFDMVFHIAANEVQDSTATVRLPTAKSILGCLIQWVVDEITLPMDETAGSPVRIHCCELNE